MNARAPSIGLVAALLLLAVPVAHANWLTHIMKEAGEAGGHAGGKVARAIDGPLDDALRQLKALPEPAGGSVALAAHVGPEGHWHFANKAGDTFTAATPDELALMPKALAPDAASDAKLSIYLTPETVFADRAAIEGLPKTADLHIAGKGPPLKLVKRAGDAGEKLFAETASGLLVDMTDQALFDEAVFRLAQKLKPSAVRVVALAPGGPNALLTVPKFDSATKTALVDAIDPASLPGALRSLPGQTVVVTGRVDGTALYFRPERGAEAQLDLAAVRDAAREAGVNLVIVRAETPLQPGGRNWFWQKVEVAGLGDAVRQPTYGDFLSSLAPKGSGLVVAAERDGAGRMVLRATPASGPPSAIGETWSSWTGSLASHVLGEVVLKAADLHVADKERQTELDDRIIPGIPSAIQYTYLIALLAGIFANAVARGWFARIWPAEAASEYASKGGYAAAWLVRWLVFGLLFLPVVAFPALVVTLAWQVWSVITAPFRFLGWLKRRVTSATP